MAEKIKIAFLDYSPHFAGAERALCTIISHLDRTKFEPMIIFPYPREHHSRYSYLNCEIKYLSDELKWWMGSDRWKNPVRGTDMLKRMIFGHRMVEFLKSRHISILHVNLLRPDNLMWLWEANKRGINIVGHFRSLPMSWVPAPSVQKLCSRIISVSNIVRENAMSIYNHPANVVIYDSVPNFALKGIIEKKPIISSVAALFPNKGHDNAIRAFAKIANKYPEYELHIVGGGRKDVLENLEKIALEEGISSKVKFTRKQVDDIGSVYAQSTLVLSLTKEGEAFGLVPFEAAQCGTITIAPDRGAIKEILTNGESALLVDTESVDAIAAKMDWALQNIAECTKICERTREIVQTKLTPEVMCRKIEAVYSNLSCIK